VTEHWKYKAAAKNGVPIIGMAGVPEHFETGDLEPLIKSLKAETSLHSSDTKQV